MIFGSVVRSAAQAAATDRLRDWTKVRFSLPEDSPVLVAEVACVVPGCPPIETVVAFWTADDTRHHFKIFKPVREVVSDDLPYAWLKAALAVPEGFDSECC